MNEGQFWAAVDDVRREWDRERNAARERALDRLAQVLREYEGEEVSWDEAEEGSRVAGAAAGGGKPDVGSLSRVRGGPDGR